MAIERQPCPHMRDAGVSSDAVFARVPELPPPKANRFALGIPPATARAAGSLR